MDHAFQYAHQISMCTEKSYPYKAKEGACLVSRCSVGIPKGSVVGFKDVSPYNAEALMDAVAQQPVSIAIEADKPVFQLYKRGVLTTDCGTTLDHGVLLVGYGNDGAKSYWKVKNSWGSTWGEHGYIRLARGVNGPGECGLESQPSYPIVKSSPVPAPRPTPSPPPAPPAPATGHYEKPPCQSDEMDARVQGVNGAVCAPRCDSSRCPSDVPPGTTAQPQCALLDSATGSKYCALICTSDSSCPSGATCGAVGSASICVYPSEFKSGLNTKRLEFMEIFAADLISV